MPEPDLREIAQRIAYDKYPALDLSLEVGKQLARAYLERTEPVEKPPTKVREWDGADFCGACNEVLIIQDQPYCHGCGTRLFCDHDKSFNEYCGPCGRTTEK